MRHTGLALVLASLMVAPAQAAPEPYATAFVSAFADACLPGRLSYEGTQAAAVASGWVETPRSADPELETILEFADAEAQAPELQGTFAYRVFSRPIGGADHFLVVSRSSFVIDPDEEPANPWVLIGCYLYNLRATAPINPAPVSDLLGVPVANAAVDETMTGYVWGPPCPMPRTGDTYMTFVPEGSPHEARTGFSGLVLKFSTSEPDPGEVVPATYC